MAFPNHSSSPDCVSQVTIKSIPTNNQLYQEFKFLDFPRPRSSNSLRLASESSGLGDRLRHHVKVYVLADRYGVEQLMELSIHQLHSELLTSTSVEVMSVLEFCWSQPVPEKLHNMLIRLVTCAFSDLWKQERFRDLVEANNDFCKQVMQALADRLE
jgi:hypothetical protein